MTLGEFVGKEVMARCEAVAKAATERGQVCHVEHRDGRVAVIAGSLEAMVREYGTELKDPEPWVRQAIEGGLSGFQRSQMQGN